MLQEICRDYFSFNIVKFNLMIIDYQSKLYYWKVEGLLNVHNIKICASENI